MCYLIKKKSPLSRKTTKPLMEVFVVLIPGLLSTTNRLVCLDKWVKKKPNNKDPKIIKRENGCLNARAQKKF